ncbi:glucosaminidase domain-containing protein [Companilactobacillus futsaii]|uniref:Peptidoglycan hydrolase n=2 Tax=Companilactobacillus futsaii TaxID=938155 RepID=A0A5B7SXB0_9LACO|nr:glucosaminidase domain-containing protein [Companilactobacillus futsaii]KRK90946.1 autolysin [Companilactobacillus futsaii JCM 17355]QCX24328.1 LysM peptidoglycan-binding domain-containing protein [Companilactobacillus futsaii]
MVITRYERKLEDSRLTRLNNKKAKNANLRRNLTLLGSSMFVGTAVAEVGFSKPTTVKAEALSVNNLLNQNIATGTVTPVSSKGIGDEQFIDYIGNSARKLASNNDLYASVMIAQAMVESGWGTSGLASAPNYNLFGIKGDYDGESVNMGTQEDDGSGNLYSISSNFRKYPSYKESLEDYVSLLRGGTSGDSQLYAGAWKSNTTSYKDATKYLTGRYATDTTYADKLNNMIEKYHLTQFDTNASDKDQTYTVAQGDTLQSIADKFNMSAETLMSLNDLKTDNYIYPGKTLTVTKIIGNEENNVSVTNLSNKISDDTGNVGDAYGDQQAPVFVQDERDGVKKYVPSNDDYTSTINVQNDYSSNDSDSDSQNKSVTVQSGDTIDSIATQAGTSIDNIKQLNNLNSDLLVVGQTLLV